jgi:hypothetical protein
MPSGDVDSRPLDRRHDAFERHLQTFLSALAAVGVAVGGSLFTWYAVELRQDVAVIKVEIGRLKEQGSAVLSNQYTQGDAARDMEFMRQQLRDHEARIRTLESKRP